jgi:hypothetical protein
MSILDKRHSQEKVEDIDWVERLGSEGTADYVDDNYWRRKFLVGALIVEKSLPYIVLYHLQKLKECYCLGLYEATIIYCRALIEASTYQALKNREKEVIPIRRELKLVELLNRIKKYKKNTTIINGAYEVKNDADAELHETEKVNKINEDIAYDDIQKTFSYIEYIFNNSEK